MTSTPSSHDSSTVLAGRDLAAGGISHGASRAGRELVWLTVAMAFLVVEAVVFLTDLPVSKIFGRRDLHKTATRVHDHSRADQPALR